jgi:hypothetical protein
MKRCGWNGNWVVYFGQQYLGTLGVGTRPLQGTRINELYPAHRFWTAKAFDQQEPNRVSDIIYYGPQEIRDEEEAESADDDGFKNCHGPSRSSLFHFVLFYTPIDCKNAK